MKDSCALLLCIIFLVENGFALDNQFPQKTWHSYVFYSGVGNREGLKLSNFTTHDFGIEKHIHKWKTLEDQHGVSMLGLGEDFIQLTSLRRGNKSSSVKIELEGDVIDIVVFQTWNPGTQSTENFAIVAICGRENICNLIWYEIIDKKMVEIWNWIYYRNIIRIEVLSFNYDLQLLIISRSQSVKRVVSAEIYSFSMFEVVDLWLYDKFTLDDTPSSIHVIQSNDNIFISFAFPNIEMVHIYRYESSLSGVEGHGHFILHRAFFSKRISSLNTFCCGFHCYLAVAGSESYIYKFKDNFDVILVSEKNFGSVKKWLPVSLNTYHGNVLLLAERENDTIAILWSKEEKLDSERHLSQLVCGTDDDCGEELSNLSLDAATSYFLNNHHTIVFTSTSGESKLLDFSVSTESLPDTIQLELEEITKYKLRLQENWMEQDLKVKKLDEATELVMDEFNKSDKYTWKMDHLVTQSVHLMPSPNATIERFEFANNTKWIDEDYKVYLDLMNDPELETTVMNKIKQMNVLFNEFESTNSIEVNEIGGMLVHDVSFLGHVVIHNLELSYLNGIEVDNMLQNSLTFGNTRKIGGVKTAINITADHIIFNRLGDTPAEEIMFSDDLVDKKNGNIINGNLVYENDLVILNELELIPDETNCSTYNLYPFQQGRSFTDEIELDHLTVEKETIVEDSLNDRPVILPNHNLSQLFSLSSENNARVEVASVRNNLNVSFINGVNVTEFFNELWRNRTLELRKNQTGKLEQLFTKKLDIEYLNGIKFPEGFLLVNDTSEKDEKSSTDPSLIEMDTPDMPQGKSVEEDHVSDELIGELKIRKYKNFTFNGILQAEMINDVTWSFLKDILRKDEVKPRITGKKTFTKCTMKNLSVTGTLNGRNPDNIMNNFSDQEGLAPSFSDVEFEDLNVTGTWDGIDIHELVRSTIRLSQDGVYNASLIFEDGVTPHFSNLVVSKSINGACLPSPMGPGCEWHVYGNLSLHELVAEQMIINGSLTSGGKINNVNLTEFNLSRLSKSQPQTIERDLDYGNVTVLSRVHVTGHQDVEDEPVASSDVNVSRKILDVLNGVHYTLAKVTVKGDVTTANGVNGVNITKLDEEAVHLTRSSVLTGRIVFEDSVTFNNIRLSGRIQGFHLRRMHNDLVFDPTYVSLKGEKNFTGSLRVLKKMNARTLNGRLLQRILTKNGDHTIKGPIVVNGDVHVTGNVTAYGSVNGVRIKDLIRRYSEHHRAFVLPGNVTLRVSEIDKLVVHGAIQNRSFNSFIEEVVTVTDGGNLTAKMVFLGDVIFDSNVTVEDTMNGLNLTQFRDDIILVNENMSISGNLILGEAIMQDVHVQNDFNATLIHGIDTNVWLEESIPLHEPVEVSGEKIFAEVTCSGDISANYINNHSFETLIPLHKEQFVPCSVVSERMTTMSDVQVGRWVNGKVLMTEFEDTLMTDGDQEVTGRLTFLNDLTVHGDVTMETAMNRNISDVITLNTDQTISSELQFDGTVKVNANIEELHFINGIDIREWSNKSITLNTNQTIEGHWTIMGNVTVYKDVDGDGLLGSSTVEDVRKSFAKMEMLVEDLQERRLSEYDQLCESVANISRDVSLQPSVFHHFESFQILNAPLIESVITFKANDSDYLLLTFVDECLSILNRWNGSSNKFQFVSRVNIGPVTTWLAMERGNATYLVTSSVSNVACEEGAKRGNVWIFHSGKLGHLMTMDGFTDAVHLNESTYYTLAESGAVWEWTLGNAGNITGKVVISLGEGHHRFLDSRVTGGLAYVSGRHIRNRDGKVVHTLPRPHHGPMPVGVVNGKLLVAVAYQDVIVLYENVMEDRVYATVPTSRIGSMLWFDVGLENPFLIYETHQKYFEIVTFRGNTGDYKKIKIPIPSHRLAATSVHRGTDLRPKQILLLIQKRKLILLEAVIAGNLYTDPGYSNFCRRGVEP